MYFYVGVKNMLIFFNYFYAHTILEQIILVLYDSDSMKCAVYSPVNCFTLFWDGILNRADTTNFGYHVFSDTISNRTQSLVVLL